MSLASSTSRYELSPSAILSRFGLDKRGASRSTRHAMAACTDVRTSEIASPITDTRSPARRTPCPVERGEIEESYYALVIDQPAGDLTLAGGYCGWSGRGFGVGHGTGGGSCAQRVEAAGDWLRFSRRRGGVTF